MKTVEPELGSSPVFARNLLELKGKRSAERPRPANHQDCDH